MKQKPKVLLISPNSTDDLDNSLISYSMALGYLGPYAEAAGWDVIVKDCYCDDWKTTEKALREVIAKDKPQVMGVNCITMNRMGVYNTIDLARKLAPDMKIIIGGVHPTTFPKHFLIDHPGDAVVRYEGEETFKELLEKIAKGKSIKDVQGIAYPENGEVKLTPLRPQIQDLDSMPYCRHEYFLNEKSKKAYFFSSRGCPSSCNFCSTVLHWGHRYRMRTPKSMVDEIEHVLKKYPNIEEIRFMDDIFTLDNQRVIEICKEMINRNIKVKWRAEGRTFPTTPEMIKWMDKAGCIMLSFGVETGSPKLLKEVGKNQTVEQIKNAFKTVYQYSKNIEPEMFFILGLPNETEETVNESIKMVKEIIDFSGKPLALTTARFLEIYPGTDIYEIAKQKGMIEDDYWLTNPRTPIYFEQSEQWLTKQRYRILFANWTHPGIKSVTKFLIKKQMWRPRKIYNVIRPYLKGENY